MDDNVKRTLQKIPLLNVKAGPRDGDAWVERLKQEYKALIEVPHSLLLSSLLELINSNGIVVCENEQAIGQWLVFLGVQCSGHKVVREMLVYSQLFEGRVWCAVWGELHHPSSSFLLQLMCLFRSQSLILLLPLKSKFLSWRIKHPRCTGKLSFSS